MDCHREELRCGRILKEEDYGFQKWRVFDQLKIPKMGLEEAVSEKSETDKECLKKDIQMKQCCLYSGLSMVSLKIWVGNRVDLILLPQAIVSFIQSQDNPDTVLLLKNCKEYHYYNFPYFIE